MILLPLLLLASAADQKSTDKLPPANPLPPPVSEEGQVMAPINALFDGLARRDSAIILAAMRPDGTATAASEKAVYAAWNGASRTSPFTASNAARIHEFNGPCECPRISTVSPRNT